VQQTNLKAVPCSRPPRGPALEHCGDLRKLDVRVEFHDLRLADDDIDDDGEGTLSESRCVENSAKSGGLPHSSHKLNIISKIAAGPTTTSDA